MSEEQNGPQPPETATVEPPQLTEVMRRVGASAFVDWSAYSPDQYRGPEEPEIEDLVGLLPRGAFLRGWTAYLYTLTDGHSIYQVSNGLALLATLTPTSVMLPDGDELAPNWFAFCLGPSRQAHKTFAVKTASKMTLSVAKELWVGMPGSTQWFTDRIIASPRFCVFIEEGQFFLEPTANANSGPYQGFRAKLMETYDGSAQQRATLSKRREAKSSKKDGKESNAWEEAERIETNPRVSMLVAATMDHIEEWTYRRDWAGGFMPRFYLAYGERRRNYSKAMVNKRGYGAMRAHASRLAAIRGVGECAGFDEAGNTLYDDWQHSLPTNGGDELVPIVEGAMIHARKAALLAAYDEHTFHALRSTSPDAALAEPWSVQERHVLFGCALGSWHVAAGWKLARGISENEDVRLMLRMMRVLGEREECPMAEVYIALKRRKKDVDQLADTLEGMQKARRLNGVFQRWNNTTMGAASNPFAQNAIYGTGTE